MNNRQIDLHVLKGTMKKKNRHLHSFGFFSQIIVFVLTYCNFKTSQKEAREEKNNVNFVKDNAGQIKFI